jgi:hypothetical protein
MGLYSQIYLYANGSLLAENTTIETALEADIQDVMTIGQEWAGISPSPIVRTVTATNVVPIKGVEFDAEQKMLDFEEVELTMQEGGSGKKCTTKGYIVNVPRSAGVGQTTNLNFTFRGTPSPFEGGL